MGLRERAERDERVRQDERKRERCSDVPSARQCLKGVEHNTAVSRYTQS